MDTDLSEADIYAASDAPPAPPAVATPPEPQRQEPTERREQGDAQAQPEDPFRRERDGFVHERKQERDRRKAAEALVAARDRELAEMRGRFSTFEQLLSRQAQPQQPAQPAAPLDFFENPEAAVRAQTERMLREGLNPFVQHAEQMRKALDYNNRMLAQQIHTPEVVKAAEEAFNTAAARGEIDPNEHRRINGSPNPYAAAVEWHKRNETLSKVGDDPDKWFEQTFEQRIASDPEFQRKIYERLQGQAQDVQANGRAPPVFTPLPSVNAAQGSSARGPSSISEDDIYAAAPQKMGRR